MSISPSPISLTLGETLQATASVYDANNNLLSGQTITWSSNDPTRLTVSTTGLLCAGTWNANFTVCTAGTAGNPILTATTSSNIQVNVSVLVHGPVVGGVALVTISPAAISLNRGQVFQATGTALDENNRPVTSQAVTFTSSDTTVLTTSTSGLLCAGTWDTNFIHCTPGPVGTSNLTATATPANVTSNATTVYVHDKADSLVVGPVGSGLACGVPSPTPAGCVSMGAAAPANTSSYTAIACSNDTAICGPNPPCQLPNATLGAFTFSSVNTAVATVAADTNNPNTVTVATARGPGVTQITATLSDTNSLPATFTTCPPSSIVIHVASQPSTATTVSIAKAATSTLAADAIDTQGVAMTSPPLTWSSSITPVATVSTGLITGVNSGTTNIVASCTPPTCNFGTKEAIYSNVVTATVTGTANAANVYATSSDAGTTTIVPINTSTNTAGTAINLPGGFSPPNSFIFANTGTRAYLGSDSGLILLDPVAGTTSGVTSAKGKVLAVSADGNQAIIVDTTTPNTVYLFNALANSVIFTYSISGATAADFTPDSSRVIIVASGAFGDRVYEIANGVFSNNPASGPPTGVALLASGAFAYVADPNTEMYSTCTNGFSANATADTPTLIRAAAKPIAAPNNTNLQMLSVVGSQIEQIDVVPGAAGNPCPQPPSNTANAYSFPGVAAFTPVQMLVTPDSSKAIITASDVNKLLVYTLGIDAFSGTASTIPLAGAATGSYTAAVTMDSVTVYAGVAGANEVQVFTLSSGALVTQISVPLSPKLVAIRNQ
ncbi:MAG: hypothetical protein LAN37_14915 [Acidobacteriia bacterium]|nr:hypothetical protein [Terriglobia bacterium]